MHTSISPNGKPRRRKVCVVVASRANYARIKSALAAIRDHPDLELQVVAGASLVLERFGGAVSVMEADGFKADAIVRFIIEGESPTTMAKSTGLGLLELPSVFELLQPDVQRSAGAGGRHESLCKLMLGST